MNPRQAQAYADGIRDALFGLDKEFDDPGYRLTYRHAYIRGVVLRDRWMGKS